ncbi:amidohydrolase family protein [Dactylosporangium fulvum]|uniref:Amidohydrolase family protein n=1 Tax=Dactylosporangium fulvum TaxID=53359 RepID=A0ABY5WAL1_9ACTN|nr:amidohydrolase family protein [Dactylosporangium fulvum]UWP87100.1 amidohydrolase family protein [Dactylosporangium fulvum]
MRYLVQGGHVVTMEPGVGELPGADVLVDDGRIVAVGEGLDDAGAEVVDARGLVVAPGFADTHRHVWQAPLRGIGADMSLGRYLAEVLGRIATRYSPRDMWLATYLGALEALDAGVTTVFDWCNATQSPEHADASLDALGQAGIRALFGHGDPDDEAGVRRLAGTRGLVTTAIATTGAEFLPFDLASRHLALARELGMVASMHVGVGTHGPRVRAVTRLGEAGLLGPDLLLAHCNTLGDDEVRMVVGSGAGVSVTPVVECMMGHGTPAYGRFAAAGGTPSLGVDVPVGARPDLFEQMRAALVVERMHANRRSLDAGADPATVVPAAADLLRAATVDGARALGLAGRVGSLGPGKRADVILVAGLEHLAGGAPVAGALVAAGAAVDVRTVFVDGRIVKRDGHLVADLAKARVEAEEAARRILAA